MKTSILDTLSSIELTVSAAVVIVVATVALGRTPRSRVSIAAVLTGWFVVVTGMGAAGTLTYSHGTGIPGLGLSIVLPVIVLCLAVAFSSALKRALLEVPIWLLVSVHLVRLLGVSFLLLHADGRLAAPFATVAGWGDIIVGAAALPVAWFARSGGRGRWSAVLVWNAIGMLDLLAAVVLGILSSPGSLNFLVTDPTSELMATLPWLLIPGFLVPLLLSGHIALFYRLRTTSGGWHGPVSQDNPTSRFRFGGPEMGPEKWIKP